MIKKVNLFLLLILILNICACSWFPHSKQVSFSNPSESIEKSKIVNAQRLRQGGSVAFLALKAGVGVEATEQLDRISLEIVKGFSEYLKENSTSLIYVGAGKANDAPLIISGNFVLIDFVSSLWPFAKRKITVSLTIDGKMFDSQTKETIAVFNFNRKLFGKKVDMYQIGYLLGQDLGKFLISSSD